MNCYWKCRVARAKVASARAVANCNVARVHAAGVVHTSNPVHVEGRDAAALAALDASFRCDAASLAALEVAVRCEALAEEAAAKGLAAPAAASAAERAREAAASCDADGGAVAASHAANAFADSCAAACGNAAGATSAAQETADRCCLARDDAYTAVLVFVSATWLNMASKLAHFKAVRRSVDGHKKARKDAIAAALAARTAALRCAAASRHAVSAASVARKIASRCDAAGGDGAAAAARQAANRCVAAHADFAAAGANVPEAAAVEVEVAEAAAGLAVPLADAAASKARKAAASCDAALANQVADPDKEFVDKMRGWLMAVAALFVGIAFQAISHPPAGMSFDHCVQTRKDGEVASDAPASSPSAAPAPSPAEPYGKLACSYLALNTGTMALALTLLVALLIMKKSTPRFALLYIQLMLAGLAVMVAGSFIIGISGNQRIQLTHFRSIVGTPGNQHTDLSIFAFFVGCTIIGSFWPIFSFFFM